MTKLKVEMIDRELRVKAREFCTLADTCPHVGHRECSQCIRNSSKASK